jgi:hypothetical protein
MFDSVVWLLKLKKYFLHVVASFPNTTKYQWTLVLVWCTLQPINTLSLSKDNEAARRRFRRRIINTLRKPMTLPTKLAKESERV